VTAKTRALLRQHTASGDLMLPGAIHELGAKELIALKQSVASDTAKVLNLRKILAVTVEKEGASQPFLLSIGERAEALAQLYEDRHITTQQALAEFEKLSLESVEADAERQRLGVDANTFAIYTIIKAAAPDVRPEDAGGVNALFAQYPEYQWNEQQQRDLRANLYKALRPIVGAGMLKVTDSLLELRRV
jgi:type I restriction enzyme R subunit